LKTLSSFQTLAWKTVIPATIIGLSFLAVYSKFDSELPPPPLDGVGGLVLALVPVAIITMIFVPLAIRLKEVTLDGDTLQIINYFRRYAIPLTFVENVTETRFLRPPIVTLRLNTNTPFGRTIIFIPGMGGTWWHRRRVSDEIREHLSHVTLSS